MTDKQPEALRLAEMLTADEWPGSVTLVSYARECVAELLRLHAENETLRMGYAAARLEIASLQARIKTMAEEHADELTVAHLDGRMRASHGQAPAQAAPVRGTPADLPPLPDPDLRDVGTNPEDIKNFLRGYATEYAKVALAARAPADIVLEDAAQVEIDLFNDLNRIYGNTLTAYAKELCRLGYRKTNAARKQGETND